MGRMTRVLSTAGSWWSLPVPSPRPFRPSSGPAAPEFRRRQRDRRWLDQRNRQRRARRAPVRRHGVGARRHDGDDGHRHDGRFSLQKLPAGDYTLRAHLAGFAASTARQRPRGAVSAPPCTACSFTHRFARRHDGPQRPTRSRRGRSSPPGSVCRRSNAEMPETAPAADDHSHTRHGVAPSPSHAQHFEDLGQRGCLRRRREHQSRRPPLRPRRARRGIVCRLAFRRSAVHRRGQSPHDRRLRRRAICSLATSSRAEWRIWRSVRRHRRGDWALRAAMSEGDLSSWIVAGSFVSRRDRRCTRTISASPTARRNIRAATRWRWQR